MKEYTKNLGKVVMTPKGAWSIEKEYEILDIVHDSVTEHAYISKQEVPSGVDLSDSRYWMPLNVSGYSDSNVITLNSFNEDGEIQSYTLEEAIKNIKDVGRKSGAILIFYNDNTNRLDITTGCWEIWQFNSINVYDWENLDAWINIYYNYNKFVGWYAAYNTLNKEIPNPDVGCYAFVGNIYNEAFVYRCDVKNRWTKTNQKAQHYIKVVFGNNVTIGNNGNWWQDEIDTNIPVSVKGDNGLTPYLRWNNDVIEYSYNNVDWFVCSEYLISYFRWHDNKIQTKKLNSDWRDLSPEFKINIKIDGYVSSINLLPNNVQIGSIYGVGPTYVEDDTNQTNPIYRIYVYTFNGWIDNGIFKGFSAGVVQEKGNSATEVMSQDAVTRELTELESNIITKSSFCITTNGGDSHFLTDIVKNNNDIIITFNSNITILGNVNGNPYSYSDLQTKGVSYNVPNAHGLVLDWESGNIEIKDLVANYSFKEFAQSNKILICANLRGVLISPIASFQSEISYLANNKPLDTILFGGFAPYSKHLVIGSINTESGVIEDNNMCVATDGLEVAVYGQQIKYSDDIFFMLFICDSQGKPVSSTGWLTNGGVYTFDADCYYKLQFTLNPMVNISNIEDVRSKVQFDTKGQYLSKEDMAKSQLANNDAVVVVAKSGGDFNSVRDAVESITDASENRRYKVFVKNGTYHEIDIRTKDFVDIEGESKDGVILYTDGHAETISPSNYNFSPDLYSGIPIKDIPKAYKHLFLHISNSKISNLTMLVYHCKYIVHQDGWSHEYDALVENCVIKRGGDYNGDIDDYDKSLQNLVGIGAFGGQKQRYINCDFMQELYNIPNEINFEIFSVIWHNWNEQSKSAGLTMKDCNIYGCNIANIVELGSGQQDVVELVNCISNNTKYGVVYDQNEIATGQDYCIKVDVYGGNIPFILLSKNRLNGAGKIYNPYTMEKMQVNSGCKIGQAIAIKAYGWGGYDIADKETRDFAFALEDKYSGDFCFLNKGKIGYGLSEAGTYHFGDKLYISNNGMFSKVDNGNAIGICLENTIIESDALLKISKL